VSIRQSIDKGLLLLANCFVCRAPSSHNLLRPPSRKTRCLIHQVAQIAVHAPIRLAYDNKTDSVVVGSMDLANALESMAKGTRSSSLVTSFDASSRKRRAQRAVETRRGIVNAEGLTASGGYALTGGYNNQVWCPDCIGGCIGFVGVALMHFRVLLILAPFNCTASLMHK